MMMGATKKINSIDCSFEQYSFGVLCSKDQYPHVHKLAEEYFDRVLLGYILCKENPGMCVRALWNAILWHLNNYTLNFL